MSKRLNELKSTSSSESIEQLLSQLKQMELGVSHVQNLSSLTPIVDNIFDKYNKNLVPIRSLSDHDIRANLKVPVYF